MKTTFSKIMTGLLCSALSVAMLAGCGGQAPAEAEKPVQEVIETVEKVVDLSQVTNNNGHFVQVGDVVYFHVTDADFMDTTNLFAQYSDSLCGRTVLMAYDTKNRQTVPVDYDYSSGPIAAQGNILYSLQFRDTGGDPDFPDAVLGGFSRATGEKLEDLSPKNRYLIGAGVQDSFVAAYQQSPAENVPDSICIYKDGTLQNSFEIDGYCGSLKPGRNEIFYIRETGGDGYTLQQVDIRTGEQLELGTLPDFEASDWVGIVDQCMIDGDSIYFTYSDYEGTGNFFTEGFYVQAEIGKEGSLQYTDMPQRAGDDEAGVTWFAVVGGEMVAADGEPCTCTVTDDGVLGYYDELGAWIPIAKGWGTEFLTEDGDYNGVELAERVGDSIYLIYNSNVRAAEDDIGWRYAYYRNYTDIYRVSIETGEAELVLHQAAPWSD